MAPALTSRIGSLKMFGADTFTIVLPLTMVRQGIGNHGSTEPKKRFMDNAKPRRADRAGVHQ